MPATAKDIPIELHDYILDYAGTDDCGKVKDWCASSGEDRTDHVDLVRCSLVCLRWAIRSRRLLFAGAFITLRSLKAAETLIDITLHGSKRLVPLLDLIGGIRVFQYLKSPSWIHHLSLPRLRRKLCRLKIRGPTPHTFPLELLRTPHWSVPATLPPTSTPYSEVLLSKIHFASFSDLLKLVRHFTSLEWFTCRSVTWDTRGVAVPVSRRADKHYRLERIEATGCTDNPFLCMEISKLNPRFPLQNLHPRDAEIVTAMIREASTIYTITACNQRPPLCIISRDDGRHELFVKLRNNLNLPDFNLVFSPEVQQPIDSRGSAVPNREVLTGIAFALEHEDKVRGVNEADYFVYQLDLSPLWKMIPNLQALRALVFTTYGTGWLHRRLRRSFDKELYEVLENIDYRHICLDKQRALLGSASYSLQALLRDNAEETYLQKYPLEAWDSWMNVLPSLLGVDSQDSHTSPSSETVDHSPMQAHELIESLL